MTIPTLRSSTDFDNAGISGIPFGGKDTDELRFRLIQKIETLRDRVTDVQVLKHEDGLIILTEDGSVQVWAVRSTGQYWPSISHKISTIPTRASYNSETHRLFVGGDDGSLFEFSIEDNFNSLKSVCTTAVHSSSVMDVFFSLACELVITAGRDKRVVWSCSERGRTLGACTLNSWCTSVAFDEAARYVFVGEYNNTVSVLRINDSDYSVITTLSAHNGSVRCLSWDSERQWLFSGSFDQSVIIWDIGGKRGTAYELQGHLSKVVAVAFAATQRLVFSASDDGRIVCWDLQVRRSETPVWNSSDTCEKCDLPFFWNVKEQWHRKTVGVRQHHCRHCGRAVCATCSANSVAIPPLGFEMPVRVCDFCWPELSQAEFRPYAKFLDAKQNIVTMHLDETRARLITVGMDKHIKIWDIGDFLK